MIVAPPRSATPVPKLVMRGTISNLRNKYGSRCDYFEPIPLVKIKKRIPYTLYRSLYSTNSPVGLDLLFIWNFQWKYQ